MTAKPTSCEIAIADSSGTSALAAALAPHLRAGDALLLDGALAAGKTTFLRDLIAALGCEDNVTSPTYTIANIHESPVPIVHMDAYRLSGPREFHHLGLDEYEETAIWLIEWGQNVLAAFDAPLRLHIAPGGAGEESRLFRFSANAPRWASVLEALRP